MQKLFTKRETVLKTLMPKSFRMKQTPSGSLVRFTGIHLAYHHPPSLEIDTGLGRQNLN